MAYKEMTSKELRLLEKLGLLNDVMVSSGETMRERLKDVPRGWNQWRIVVSGLGRLLDGLYKGLPDKTLLYLDKMFDVSEMTIRVKPAVRMPGMVVICEDDLRVLIDTAMHAECAICLKQGKEIDRCPLRRAMMTSLPPENNPPYACGYRDMALERAGKEGTR